MTNQTEPGLTTEQAATELGLTPSTFKRRASQFKISNQIKRNRAYWGHDAVENMRLVAQLLADGRGNDTITRRLHPDQPQTEQSQAQTEPNQTLAQPAIDPDQLRLMLRSELTQSNELAEKYARATYRIGELEAEARGKDAALAEMREQIKLLTAPKETPRTWWRFWG